MGYWFKELANCSITFPWPAKSTYYTAGIMQQEVKMLHYAEYYFRQVSEKAAILFWENWMFSPILMFNFSTVFV